MDYRNAFNITFDPLMSFEWLILAAAFALALSLLSLGFKKRPGFLRLGVALFFLLALLNPSLSEEERKMVKDVAVIVVDQSQSQSFGSREARAETALQVIKRQADKLPDLELRIIRAPEKDGNVNETALFEILDQMISEIPKKRRGGIVLLTDGQVHDVPQEIRENKYGPVHVFLTGEREEKDRKITLIQSPAYGIVGQDIVIRYKIESNMPDQNELTSVTITAEGSEPRRLMIAQGREQTLRMPVRHAGQNILELKINNLENEITYANNRAVLIVNGVRDRLRALLVSGKPHAGGRAWRDLLTGDPGVDLVHFTILREPHKLDATPQNELALIAFPFRELFETKLYDFDLIIFDQYQLNRILPDYYFKNIVRYVREGGALLEASGPGFATEDSLYFTALKDILPGTPAGDVVETGFQPSLTEIGLQHPVTHNLSAEDNNAQASPAWGRWLRQIDVSAERGDILMRGAQEKPLLILDRVGEGRVAQIASDQIWLWARGFEGGGPYRELLRRVVHWLMKEPELDEKALNLDVSGNKITLKSRDINQEKLNITVTKPDGISEKLSLKKNETNVFEQVFNAEQPGIYKFETEDGQNRYAVVGDIGAKELREVQTTAEKLSPLIETTGGTEIWLEETPEPQIRHLSNTSSYGGKSWAGFKKNSDYVVTGLKYRPLFSLWFWAALLGFCILLIWWYEGKNRPKGREAAS